MTETPRTAVAAAPRAASPLRDLLLCAWFGLVAIAYWSPALGIANMVPATALTALYAAFLVAMIAAVALRAVKSGRNGATASPADTAATEGSDGR
jgi:hypothetical protein